MWKEKLLSQRSNIAYWSPLVLIVFLITLHTTAFAGITTEFSIDDSEIQTTQEFYTDSVIVTRQSEDTFGENNSDYFGGEFSESNSYKQLNGPEESLEDSAETLDGRLGLITMSCFILVLFCFMNRKEKISINRFVSFNSIKGYLMLFIGIISLISVFTITSGLSDYSDEIADSDLDWDVDEGFWGSATVEFESFFDGESITIDQEWGPDFMMLALFVFSMIALIGGIANISYLKEDLEIEDAPVWIKDSKTFSLANRHSVTALWIVLVVAIIGSVVAPWQTINQEWEVEQRTESSVSEEVKITEHSSEISWNMNPFYMQFDNDTSLGNASFEGEETSSYDSYKEHSELSDSSAVMLELRWPLICAIIIGIFMLMQRYVGKFSSAISGTNNGWILLILTSVLLIYSYGAIGNFEDEMSKKIDNDLQDLSPSWDYEVFSSDISSSLSGSKLGSAFSSSSTVTPGEVTFDSTSSRILTTWSPAIGYYFAIIIPFAIFAILSAQYGPIVIDSINDYQSIKEFEIKFDSKSWVAKPTIIALVTLLITSSIGMGLGELMFDSKSSAPASIYKWDLDFQQSWIEDYEEIVMNDQDSYQNELDNGLNGIPSQFNLLLACDESNTGLTNEQPDSISWKINPPEGTDLFGEMNQGELQCTDQVFVLEPIFSWRAIINLPKSEFAETEEDYLNQFSVEGGGLGAWNVEVVANVNGGTTEFDEDTDLQLYFQVQSRGIGNVTAEKIT